MAGRVRHAAGGGRCAEAKIQEPRVTDTMKEGIGSTVALIDHRYKPVYTYNSTTQSKLSWNLGCDSVPEWTEWWTRAGASRGECAVTSSHTNGQSASCGRETQASRLHAAESLVFNIGDFGDGS
jgi:hypothetical protein